MFRVTFYLNYGKIYSNQNLIQPYEGIIVFFKKFIQIMNDILNELFIAFDNAKNNTLS